MRFQLDQKIVKNALVILLGITSLLSSIVGVAFLSEWVKSSNDVVSATFLTGAFLFLLGMGVIVVLLSYVIKCEKIE